MDVAEISRQAVVWANAHKKRIAREKTDLEKFPPEETPVSVFMAGSPGAGKTEASKSLILPFSSKEESVLRIDPDELRSCFEGYTGNNSSLFHAAVSILAEKIHDLALKQSQSFIFDTTLAKYDKAKMNIERALKYGRIIQILYVYQDPLQAWNFVQQREKVEGRNIPKEVFIEQYFAAHETVNRLKQEFQKKIVVDVLVENVDGTDKAYFRNISSIDNHVTERYTGESLNDVLI